MTSRVVQTQPFCDFFVQQVPNLLCLSFSYCSNLSASYFLNKVTVFQPQIINLSNPIQLNSIFLMHPGFLSSFMPKSFSFLFTLGFGFVGEKDYFQAPAPHSYLCCTLAQILLTFVSLYIEIQQFPSTTKTSKIIMQTTLKSSKQRLCSALSWNMVHHACSIT